MKSHRNIGRWLAISCALLLLLAGCIDVDVHIRLRSSEVVRMCITYQIAHEIATLGGYARRQLAALPLEEIDFKRAFAAHTGVELQRYRQRKRRAHREVRACVRFDSFAAFNDVFAGMEPQMRIAGRGVTIPLATPRPIDSDPQQQELTTQFYEEFFSDNTITVRLRAPRRITVVSAGESRGRRATISYPLSELAATAREIVWSVDWWGR